MQKIYLAFGLCAALVACGSSESVNRGGVGETCSSHNDCVDNLICDRGVCATSPAATALDGGATSPVTVVTSGPGESCTKTADCVTGYKCFSGVCALSAPVVPPEKTDAAIIYVVNVEIDAGVPPAPTNPVLSGRGETCTQSSDCEQGLFCLPDSSSAAGLGVCDVANYGLTPGTKSCYAECEKEIDCCELPIGSTASTVDGGVTTVQSCSDLLKAMTPYTGLNCSDVAALAHECFLYKTYCDCATSNPWTCTAGTCNYIKACDPTVSGELINGCPAKTRSSNAVPACNATSKKCAVSVSTAGCTTADDCTTLGTFDTGESCSSGECVCITDATVGVNGACYRKCNADLDCRAGYVCDVAKSVCKAAGGCATDAYCKVTLKNVGAKCVVPTGAVGGTCRLPCTTDQDCSPSGLSGDFNGMVCGADHYCASLGCSSNDECSKEVDGQSIRMFCAAPPAAASNPYVSAITD
jgi:hypothetical protein